MPRNIFNDLFKIITHLESSIEDPISNSLISFLWSLISYNTMARTAFSKLVRSAARQTRPFTAYRSSAIARSYLFRQSAFPISTQDPRVSSPEACRSFSTTRPSFKGLSPETENPQPKKAERNATASAPADITVKQYNALSDDYMNTLVEKLEQLQEARDGVDVEYSVHLSSLSRSRC